MYLYVLIITIDIAKWFMYNEKLFCLKRTTSYMLNDSIQYRKKNTSTFSLSPHTDCSLLFFTIAPLEEEQTRLHIIRFTVETRLLLILS
jgi:hypothetical protein